MDTLKMLCLSAIKASESAYSPYSDFKVGAAIMTSDGDIYTGCNIENASYGATICAERVAVSKAISDGKRNLAAIAIVGMKNGKISDAFPCGICRQVLSEFGSDDMKVLVVTDNLGNFTEYTLGGLLPYSFKL